MYSFLLMTLGGIMGFIGLALTGIVISVAIGNPTAGIVCGFILWELWRYVSKQEDAKQARMIAPLVDRRGSSMDD